jgi:hypothetical protein
LINTTAAVFCGASTDSEGGTISGGVNQHPLLEFTELNSSFNKPNHDGSGIYSGAAAQSYVNYQYTYTGPTWRCAFAVFTNCSGTSVILDESADSTNLPLISYCTFCTNHITETDAGAIRLKRWSSGVIVEHCLFWHNAGADFVVQHDQTTPHTGPGTIRVNDCVFSASQTTIGSVTFGNGNKFSTVTATPSTVVLLTELCYITPVVPPTSALSQSRSFWGTSLQKSLGLKRSVARLDSTASGRSLVLRKSSFWAPTLAHNSRNGLNNLPSFMREFSGDLTGSVKLQLTSNGLEGRASSNHEWSEDLPTSLNLRRTADFEDTIAAACTVVQKRTDGLNNPVSFTPGPSSDHESSEMLPISSIPVSLLRDVTLFFRQTQRFTETSECINGTQEFAETSDGIDGTQQFPGSVAFSLTLTLVTDPSQNDAQSGDSTSSTRVAYIAGLVVLAVLVVAFVVWLLFRRRRVEMVSFEVTEADDSTGDFLRRMSREQEYEMRTAAYENPIVDSSASDHSDPILLE